MIEINTIEGDYQNRFLNDDKHKFCALISAIGTGKTLCALVKMYQYLEKYPGSTWLVVRKEFTDLRDSTMVDFEKYLEVKIGTDKNYQLINGSLVMFRHAAEIQVLKNVNLSGATFEQGEEFETDEQFQYVRDRLRQNNGASVRPLIIIANSDGHNWIWKNWINNATTVNTIDDATGQREYINGEYCAWTSNTYANERNLPPDFIADLRRKEIEAPSHYRRFVLNSFEETGADDLVYTWAELQEAREKKFKPHGIFKQRIGGADIARFGSDKSAMVVIQQMGPLHWEVTDALEWENKALNDTTGRILRLLKDLNIDETVIDADGMGAGPFDTISDSGRRSDIHEFRNTGLSKEKSEDWANQRTEAAFILKDLLHRGYICIKDEKLLNELMTLKYRYQTDGRRILISKNEMRKEGVKSPNLADSLLMACSIISEVKENWDREFNPIRHQAQSPDWNPFVPDPRSGSRRQPTYSPESNLFDF